MIYIIILALIGISIIATSIFFILLPQLIIKLELLKNPQQSVDTVDQDFEHIILKRSLEMGSSNEVTMVWEDQSTNLYESFKRLLGSKKSNEFEIYNYPRAFLYLGLISYIEKSKNQTDLQAFLKIFHPYMDDNGLPSFVLNRIDQAPFGMVSLKLYEITGQQKYLKFADTMFNYLVTNVDSLGLIEYRKGLNIVLNDTLGLVIPFLLYYSKITQNNSAKILAEKQINFFIEFGVDPITGIPSHGIYKTSKVKVGSSNWGRGIGWYLIGLSYCTVFNSKYESNSKQTLESLESLKNKENLWSQFPGTSNVFDASTTLMTIYSRVLMDKDYLTKDTFFQMIKKHLTQQGEILNTSGDTYGLNEYSKTFGKSELSQGVLLLILSELTD